MFKRWALSFLRSFCFCCPVRVEQDAQAVVHGTQDPRDEGGDKVFFMEGTTPHVVKFTHMMIPSSKVDRIKVISSKVLSSHGRIVGKTVCSGFTTHTFKQRST